MRGKAFLTIFLVIFLTFASWAEVAVEKAVVTYVYGIVKMKKADAADWENVKLKTELNIGDSIKTGRRSKVEINISDKKVIKVRPDTELQIPRTIENEGGIIQTLKLLFGYIHVTGNKIDGEFNVQTPKAICGIRGTRYALEVKGPREILTVFSGKVSYVTYSQTISRIVEKGQQIVVQQDNKFEIKSVNVTREEKKSMNEFIKKEKDVIESAEEQTIQNTKPTETSTVGQTKPNGSLHIDW